MAVSVRDCTTAPTCSTFFASPSSGRTVTHNRYLPPTDLRPFRNQPHQAMAMMQGPTSARFTISTDCHPKPGSSPFPTRADAYQASAAPSALSHQHFQFEDYVQYQDEQNTDGEPGALGQWREGQSQDGCHMSTRAIDSTTGTFNSDYSGSFSSSDLSSDNFSRSHVLNDVSFPDKIDGSPALPPPAVLPYQVDTSQYENVSDEAWPMSSVEPSALSPLSMDAGSNGPLTPDSPDGFGFFGRPLLMDGSKELGDRLASIDAKADGRDRNTLVVATFDATRSLSPPRCQCTTCLGAFTQPTTLAEIFNAAQPQMGSAAMYHNQHNNNTLEHSDPYAGAEFIRAAVPATVPLPPMNTHDVSSMLVADRSAMDTTPEGSSSSDYDHSEDGNSESDGDANDQAVAEAARRRARDRYLLDMRDRGLSYKEIKRSGGFTEAESTLRGRVRVLTKEKSQRVRKPEWTANDLRLLNSAVDRYSASDPFDELSSRESHGRIPWKKISTWMENNGSSYAFAAATCAKKWRQIN